MNRGLQKPFFLGNLTLANNIFFAPLSGHTDLAFRRFCLPFRPGLFFAEMVKMDALVRNQPSTLDLLSYDQNMHPIGAQLFGSSTKYAKQAAKMIEDLGFDLLDLNCGCSVPKVTRDGSGSALLKNPEKIGEILSEMIATVKIPVTVKIRVGWDQDHIVALHVLDLAEKAGAKAITIHGRTAVCGYQKAANWALIKECKKQTKTLQVIGNGDLFTPQNVEKMFNQTGCDGVMIGRGLLTTPYIVENIQAYYEKKEIKNKTILELISLLQSHFHHILTCCQNSRALFHMKRVACWYLKGYRGMKKLRADIMNCQSEDGVLDLLNVFSLLSKDLDGIPLQKTFCALEETKYE